MRTRNSDAPKPAMAKKTPPARKAATKSPPYPPESASELATPSPTETKRAAVVKTKPVKKSETAAILTAGSDLKTGQSSAEGSKTLGDGAQVTPRKRIVKVTKRVVKRTSGRTKTPTSSKDDTVQASKSAESPKVKVVESQKEDAKEPAIENVGESSKNEGTKTEARKSAVENAVESARDEGFVIKMEETFVESAAEVEEPVAENKGESAENAMEVQVAAIAGIGDSLNKKDPGFAEVANLVEDEKTNGVKGGEVVEEKEKTRGVENKEERTVEPVNIGGNVIEDFYGEDAQFMKEHGSDEGTEDYGDRLDLGEHGEDELAEDDLEELAEYDPEEPAECTEALEEERWELTAVAKERKIKKEHEIFVGGLDRNAEEEEVRKVFEKIGEVVEVRLHRDSSTNKNKGYAFVKFANKDHAKWALSEMKNPVIHGKRCGTAPSEDNDTLFLGNICNTWTKEAIKQKLKEYGVDGVETITLVPDVQHEGLSRGFAFLEFSCHAEAMHAYKRLQKPDVVFGHAERTAKVAFAEPLREPDPSVMAQVKSVFLDGLPPHWDEDHVREQLKGYGEILRIVLARNMSTAKRKDFGFVDFSSHEAAVTCISGINNSQLGHGKMKVKARLSNPLPKTQAVKGGMCGGFRIAGGNSGATSHFGGRGFGRGGRPFFRANFQRNRVFYQGGRGQSGRMGFSNEYDLDNPYTEFRGRQFTGRGGRRNFYRGGNYAPSAGRAVATPSRPNLDRPWHSAPDRGRGMHFPSRRHQYSREGHFERSFIGRQLDDPYLYNDNAHGMKRQYYMMDHDPDYMEPSRLRPRLDYTDPSAFHGNRYHDTYAAGSSAYPHDYYGPDYGGGPYSSFYGSDRPYGGGYYY